jgi:uncharacterized protein (DUF2147 family)
MAFMRKATVLLVNGRPLMMKRQSKISCEIYERSGKIYGKIVDSRCRKEKVYVLHALARKKNKPVMGLVIIKGLKKDGKEYNDGKILDPTTGKLYKCFLAEGHDKLKVRGYIGVSLFGTNLNRVK